MYVTFLKKENFRQFLSVVFLFKNGVRGIHHFGLWKQAMEVNTVVDLVMIKIMKKKMTWAHTYLGCAWCIINISCDLHRAYYCAVHYYPYLIDEELDVKGGEENGQRPTATKWQ